MIMNEDTKITPESDERIGPKPDENQGFYFSSFVKIHDPNTGEVLVEQRGDD